MNWGKARQSCLKQGGDLAIVDNEIKRKAIDTHLTGIDKLFPHVNIRAYIGVRKIDVWQWLGGGHVSGDVWHRGYPRPSTREKCAAFSRGSLQWKLFQTACFYTLGFVCETDESKYI